VTELARGEQCDDPLLDLIDLHVEPGGDDAALVKAPVQLDNDLLRAVVIDNFEFTDVALMVNSIVFTKEKHGELVNGECHR